MSYREDAERDARRRKRLIGEERRRRRLIDEAAGAYFEMMHVGERHIQRYPDLVNADFRAWLDLSGTGRPIADQVGLAVAKVAEECPDCAISRWGELDQDDIFIKRRDAAEKAARRALTEKMVRDLTARAS